MISYVDQYKYKFKLRAALTGFRPLYKGFTLCVTAIIV